MKKTEIKNMSLSELKESLSNSKKSYRNLKLTHSVSPLENPSEIKLIRRSIARLKTEIKSKSESNA